MAILGGHFTIMLIVSTPPDADVGALTRDLDDARTPSSGSARSRSRRSPTSTA